MAKEMKTLASLPTPKKEEVKTVKAEVAENTPAMVRFDTMDKAVAYFKTAINDVRTDVLRIYYEIGQVALQIKDKAIYGKATVETFAEKLEASPQIVYSYAQFVEKYTQEEFEAVLKKDHVGWGAILKLLSVEKEKRVELEDSLHDGSLAPSKLEEAIREFKEDTKDAPVGKDGKKEPQRNYVRNMQKLMGGLSILQDYLHRAGKDVRDMDQLPDGDAREKVEEVVHSVNELLDSIWEDLEEFREDATKAISLPDSKIKAKK